MSPAVPSTLLNGLQAFWPMTEASGVRADVGGGGLDLAETGGAIGSSVAPWGQNVAEIDNTGAFERLSRSPTTGGVLSPGNSDFSVSTWVRIDTLNHEGDTNYGAMLNGIFNNSTGVGEYFLQMWALNHNIRLVAADPAAVVINFGSANFGNELGIWMFLYYSFNSATGIYTLRVWSNGSVPCDLVANSGVTNAPAQNAVSFTVGGGDDTRADEGQNGAVGPTGFWNRELTTQEQDDLIGAGTPLYYPF